jgi:heptaprenylglycerol acetyltransferase
MKKSLLRRLSNRVLGHLARTLPGCTSLRPLLHRLRGVQIQGKSFIGDDVYIENEYPECVILEDGAQICLRSTIVAHTKGLGQVILGKDAFIGAGCLIIASPNSTLRIGEGAVVAAGSVISTNVQPGTLVAPESPKALATVTVPLAMETQFTEFLKGLTPLNDRRQGAAPTPSKRKLDLEKTLKQ